MTRAWFAALACAACLLPAAAGAEEPTCAEALHAADAAAAGARADEAKALELDGQVIDLLAARAWNAAGTRLGGAARYVDSIERASCDAKQRARLDALRSELTAASRAAGERFEGHRPGACQKLVEDSRGDTAGLDTIDRLTERDVYIATAVGVEYKMMWRVSLAKAFACSDTREIFDEGRVISGRISAVLGPPKPGGCEAARKLAAERLAAEDLDAFVNYAHVALHYSDCNAEILLRSDPEFKELFETYHRKAPEAFGSVYD